MLQASLSQQSLTTKSIISSHLIKERKSLRSLLKKGGTIPSDGILEMGNIPVDDRMYPYNYSFLGGMFPFLGTGEMASVSSETLKSIFPVPMLGVGGYPSLRQTKTKQPPRAAQPSAKDERKKQEDL